MKHHFDGTHAAMRPRFRSLDELLAHAQGKGWAAIVAEFEAEYGSFDLTNLPQRQRLNHPLANYDHDLGLFYHFHHGAPPPGLSPRDRAVIEKLQRIREA